MYTHLILQLHGYWTSYPLKPWTKTTIRNQSGSTNLIPNLILLILWTKQRFTTSSVMLHHCHGKLVTLNYILSIRQNNNIANFTVIWRFLLFPWLNNAISPMLLKKWTDKIWIIFFPFYIGGEKNYTIRNHGTLSLNLCYNRFICLYDSKSR